MLGVVELIILVVVLGLVVSFMNRNRSARPAAQTNTPALLLVLGLLLAVPLVLATLYYAQMSHSAHVREAGRMQPVTRTNAASSSDIVSVVVDAPAATATIWANPEEQPFDANIYPSQVAAAKPIARKIHAALEANRLLAATSTKTTPTATDVESSDGAVPIFDITEDTLLRALQTTPTCFQIHAPLPERKRWPVFPNSCERNFL